MLIKTAEINLEKYRKRSSSFSLHLTSIVLHHQLKIIKPKSHNHEKVKQT